ncbi:2-octaprenyl-6-methoxyphenol hydroxylase [Oleiphilus messinensis]|uniref:2-octaprenyl-6-methoxyphenol hydroxylase n=1 Tax=Oleiphilus messinensis TaxID=141451 RepID=A0A1Y0I4B4_9GAMM|nr:2-octaprenyl-6-methoxyphenyl hydroxylase [Oleiphilus messinensis]ARU55080.1 2-octaprenyl-6-methoxyphenol hydroxylase [Oleiphilus messinensis]
MTGSTVFKDAQSVTQDRETNIAGPADNYDVVIVGGGLVGASLAIALAMPGVRDLRIAVVEAYPLPERGYQPSFDERSTALAWGTRLIYEQLGIWGALKEHVTPIRHIHVSDRGRFGASRLNAADNRVEALGYVVANQWIGESLMARLPQLHGIDFLAPEKVCEIEPSGTRHQHRVMLESGRALQADLVVVADGGRSGLPQKLGFLVESKTYSQVAVIANIQTERHHQWVAYERFTEQGPLAMLPLGEQDTSVGRSALVWTLPEALAERYLQLSEGAFLDQLQRTFGYRLGVIEKVGSTAHYPLSLSLVQQQARPGVVLVGNAAHTLHPVAGQGYNLALRGAMHLSAAVRSAVANGVPAGDWRSLSPFLAAQESDKANTIRFSDQVVRLFSSDHVGVSALRDAGLLGLDLMPGLKNRFARHAMGLGGKQVIV